MPEHLYVQYGCGLDAPRAWLNFDASPSLRAQRLPLVGPWLKARMAVKFPANVRYGDITRGLPIEAGSCRGVYGSHVLEHLALEDFRRALRHTLRMLAPAGIFRCVVPDLEYWARHYLRELDRGQAEAGMEFVGRRTALGRTTRPKTLWQLLYTFTRTTGHRWMWDRLSLQQELEAAGFRDIRPCQPGDCEDPMFKLVEKPARFERAVAFECRK